MNNGRQIAESRHCPHLGLVPRNWLVEKQTRNMRKSTTVLLVLLTLLSIMGAGLIALASIGDASVVAATGGIYGALESAGAQDNIALRNELYSTVLRLKGLWGVAHLVGIIVLVLSLAALGLLWRKPK